ncbi:MAG: neuromedin U [Planctomycetota bacterium]|jgi:hypothetical protein
MKKYIIVLLMLIGTPAFTAFAEETAGNVVGNGNEIIEPGEHDTGELARATQNPIADLISLPFQWNVGFENGPDDRTSSVLNIQPVYPINLNDDWNLITRTILPIVNQPPVGTLSRQEWELGNAQFSGFFSPRDSKGWIWGFGPIFEFPTHTNDVLASDNYSTGPTFVALKMQGPWVYGGLINQLWSFSGDDPEVNKMLIQPFINYNMEDGWYLSSSPIITADWTRDSSNQWNIPVGGGFGKIIRVGKLPINVSTQIFYNVE